MQVIRTSKGVRSMEFKQFKKLFQAHVKEMFKNHSVLFVTSIDRDLLWEAYLESFPPGTNEIYRERREFDCSCCRHFIKAFGNVVAVENNELKSVWDFETNDSTYQPVVEALEAYVKSEPIRDVFITKESGFGTDSNHELRYDGTVHTWEHFRIDLPKKFVTKSDETIGTLMGEYHSTKNVFKRSLEEISEDAIDIVLDLVSQKSLYKGNEWEKILTQFLALHREYNELLGTDEKENYCWLKSVEVGKVIGKIRNHSIGVLLTDLTNGVDVDEAVKRYEQIVAPTNYKRPKAIFTKKMVEQAEKKLNELGFTNSLERRFAMVEDITVNNILFANRDTLRQMGDNSSVFDELSKEAVGGGSKEFNKVEEITIEQFLEHVLPRTTNMEAFFENRHVPGLVSLIAPVHKDSPTMFKWNNPFSWAYHGNITDSMKQRVKAAGGNVEGVLRFSIQWNEESDNPNDFDAHCVEPNGNHIWFRNKGQKHLSTGMLDVDIINPGNKVAVENITWTTLNKMQEGVYEFYVHNYSHRGGRSGFRAEIEYDGQIHEFTYDKELRQDEKVVVAKVRFSRGHELEFVKALSSSSVSSRTEWGIKTNEFHPVSTLMFSPNYWDAQSGIGHRHYFFMLKECLNNTQPNGFFNEFLKEDLMQHKRVFEALGSKMRVKSSDKQLSGLGFSSTKRNHLIVKLEGHTSRTIKIIF